MVFTDVFDDEMSAFAQDNGLRQCSFAGHLVPKWAEYLDGVCVGYCSVCKEMVTSERHPGGMPLMRVKALLEQLMVSPDDLSLFLEMNDIDTLLQLEQVALNEARSLLEIARKTAGCNE